MSSVTNFNFIANAKEIDIEKFLKTQKLNNSNEVLFKNLSAMPFEKEDLKKMKEMILKSSSINLFKDFD